MTGYGRKTLSEDAREMTLEIRTVNHRYLDLNFRFPGELGFLEGIARREIGRRLRRGHADVTLQYRDGREGARRVEADLPLAGAYARAFKRLARRTGLKNDVQLSGLAALPGLFSLSDEEDDPEALSALFMKLLSDVLDEVAGMRGREGAAAESDLRAHLRLLEGLVADMARLAPAIPALHREKLEARLKDTAAAEADPQRLAQELALFADRCAIDEELARLSSHLGAMRELLSAEGECGRRLDFLVQEMHRETNTIASKAGDIGVARLALEAKNEIEKLREQIQNVE